MENKLDAVRNKCMTFLIKYILMKIFSFFNGLTMVPLLNTEYKDI